MRQTPPEAAQHSFDVSDQRRRAGAAHRVAVSVLFLCILLFPLMLALPSRATSAPAMAVATIVCGVAALLTRGRWGGVGIILMIATPSLIALALIITLHSLQVRPFYLILSILLGGMLLRPRQIWIVLAANIAGLMLTIELMGGSPFAAPLDLEIVVGALILMAIAALASSHGAASVRAALQEAQRAQKASEEASEHLLDRIAQQRAAELALRASEERFQKAFYSSPIGIVIAAVASGQVMEINDRMLEMIGADRADMANRTLSDLTAWVDPIASAQLRDLLLQRGAVRDFELAFQTTNGEPRDVLLSIDQIDLAGQACVLILCLDISARKQIEAQLIQSQKMEGIGRLAGGIAHDFNNLLTVISGNAELARATLPAEHPIHEDLRAVQSAARRATELTRQLLAFARRQLLAPRILNLNDLILDIDSLMRRMIGDDVMLVTRPGAEIGLIRADPGQIEQILVNLIVNSRDAMPDGGVITIETGTVVLDDDYVRAHAGASLGPHVLLSVSDTGMGIPPDLLPRIFEPFFTTKPAGQGTGLGLATSYGIIKQHGGSIWCQSEVGRGTTFRVYFPQVTDESEQLRTPSEEDLVDTVANDETLLLVEDNLAVRTFAARILREAGYRVLEAADGIEAIEIAAQHGLDTIDLLVSDIVMPRMGGETLARRLREQDPHLNVLLTSGYTDSVFSGQAGFSSGTQFLAKPFTAAALRKKVRDTLGR